MTAETKDNISRQHVLLDRLHELSEELWKEFGDIYPNDAILTHESADKRKQFHEEAKRQIVATAEHNELVERAKSKLTPEELEAISPQTRFRFKPTP